VAPGQSNINLLNMCNLFMVDNNSKNTAQNLSTQVPSEITCRDTQTHRLMFLGTFKCLPIII
jgi:hypothetical protein